jgi:hypothetical protein
VPGCGWQFDHKEAPGIEAREIEEMARHPRQPVDLHLALGQKLGPGSRVASGWNGT